MSIVSFFLFCFQQISPSGNSKDSIAIRLGVTPFSYSCDSDIPKHLRSHSASLNNLNSSPDHMPQRSHSPLGPTPWNMFENVGSASVKRNVNTKINNLAGILIANVKVSEENHEQTCGGPYVEAKLKNPLPTPTQDRGSFTNSDENSEEFYDADDTNVVFTKGGGLTRNKAPKRRLNQGSDILDTSDSITLRTASLSLKSHIADDSDVAFFANQPQNCNNNNDNDTENTKCSTRETPTGNLRPPSYLGCTKLSDDATAFSTSVGSKSSSQLQSNRGKTLQSETLTIKTQFAATSLESAEKLAMTSIRSEQDSSRLLHQHSRSKLLKTRMTNLLLKAAAKERKTVNHEMKLKNSQWKDGEQHLHVSAVSTSSYEPVELQPTLIANAGDTEQRKTSPKISNQIYWEQMNTGGPPVKIIIPTPRVHRRSKRADSNWTKLLIAMKIIKPNETTEKPVNRAKPNSRWRRLRYLLFKSLSEQKQTESGVKSSGATGNVLASPSRESRYGNAENPNSIGWKAICKTQYREQSILNEPFHRPSSRNTEEVEFPVPHSTRSQRTAITSQLKPHGINHAEPMGTEKGVLRSDISTLHYKRPANGSRQRPPNLPTPPDDSAPQWLKEARIRLTKNNNSSILGICSDEIDNSTCITPLPCTSKPSGHPNLLPSTGVKESSAVVNPVYDQTLVVLGNSLPLSVAEVQKIKDFTGKQADRLPTRLVMPINQQSGSVAKFKSSIIKGNMAAKNDEILSTSSGKPFTRPKSRWTAPQETSDSSEVNETTEATCIADRTKQYFTRMLEATRSKSDSPGEHLQKKKLLETALLRKKISFTKSKNSPVATARYSPQLVESKASASHKSILKTSQNSVSQSSDKPCENSIIQQGNSSKKNVQFLYKDTKLLDEKCGTVVSGTATSKAAADTLALQSNNTAADTPAVQSNNAAADTPAIQSNNAAADTLAIQANNAAADTLPLQPTSMIPPSTSQVISSAIPAFTPYSSWPTIPPFYIPGFLPPVYSLNSNGVPTTTSNTSPQDGLVVQVESCIVNLLFPVCCII